MQNYFKYLFQVCRSVSLLAVTDF